MTERLEGQMSIFDLDTWSGKTCQEPLAATKVKISAPSLKKSQGSQKKMPLFLDMRKSGRGAEPSWEMGGPLPGAYTMRSFGEYPKEENVSRLSQILEENPHPKYFLSAKACSGILNRAERRGKELPPELKKALEAQSVFKNEPGSQGGGKGILIQHEHVGALSTLNNQSVLAFKQGQGSKAGSIGAQEECSPTLSAVASGTNQVPVVYDARGNGDRKTILFEPRSQDGVPRIHGAVSPTLNTAQGGQRQPCVMCIGNEQTNQSIGDKTGALNTMHDQQAVMVCTEGVNNAETRNQILRLLQETYGAETVLKWGIAILERLQQTDILQQGVHESRISGETEKWNKLDDCALPCPSVVAGWLLRDMRQREECRCSPQRRQSSEQRAKQSNESMPELSQQNSQACKDLFDMWEKGEGLWLLREALSEVQKIWKSFNGQRQSVCGHSIVRRLTPLEAERLQGYPDGWTDIGEWVDSKGKKHKDADSPRYKALGNSIALPFWEWLARRIAAQYERHITLGSLFDGISGFCLVFARAGCKPVFSSEIEEYPIAVAKKHFGDDDLGLEGDYERYL